MSARRVSLVTLSAPADRQLWAGFPANLGQSPRLAAAGYYSNTEILILTSRILNFKGFLCFPFSLLSVFVPWELRGRRWLGGEGSAGLYVLFTSSTKDIVCSVVGFRFSTACLLRLGFVWWVWTVS